MHIAQSKIIVALDMVNKEDLLKLVEKLSPLVRLFKIGSVPFTAFGPGIIKEIKERGGGVFLDLKFHDIPNVVAGAVENAGRLGIDMLTVHTLGGEEMLKSAVSASRKVNPSPRVLGVTVLTSLEEKDLAKAGINGSLTDGVKRLASLAGDCGLDGVVASAREVKMIREILPESGIIVTPGIRPEGGTKGDQKRTMTPKEAIEAGSDYLVIGRPVTEAGDPKVALEKILKDIDGR